MIRICYVWVWIAVIAHFCESDSEEFYELIPDSVNLVEECIISNQAFECHIRGRFPDYSDKNCKKYFLCSLLHNGTMMKTPYECLRSTFDPKMGKCSSLYTCPCSLTTTKITTLATTEAPAEGCQVSNNTFECKREGRFPDSTDWSCKKYFLCVLMESGMISKTPYNCPGSSMFDPKLHTCSSEYSCPCASLTTVSIKPPSECPIPNTTFECEKAGRFPDFSEGSCKSYFLCTLLRNGTLMKTPYNCQGSSMFDPELQKCSVEYACPCSTQPESTTVSTKPPSECPIPNTTFECEKAGRFPDFSEGSCKSYFLCTLLRNGTLMKTPYNCQGSSMFDPELQKCSVEYTCPCSTQPESTTVSTKPPSECPIPNTTFECEKAGRFPDFSEGSCKSYFLCTLLRNGTLMKTPYNCQGSSMFDPELQKCSVEYACPCSTQPESTTVSTKPPSECPIANTTFECEKAGRFPDFSEGSCKSYFLCTLLRNGTLMKTPYNCQGSSMFDPKLQKCSVEYACPCSTQPESTTVSTKPPSECPIANTTFECEKAGRFPDFSEGSCKSYFLCTLLRNGTLMKTPYNCQGSSMFDPKLQKCSVEYTCPCSTRPESTTVFSTTPGCSIPSSDFECKVQGRFPNLFDTTCTKYYLCTKLRNGTFIKTPYTCQNASFNPLLGKCTSKFFCPCTNTPTTVSTIRPTTEGFTTAPSITTTNAYNCENSPTRVILPFDCSIKGRFPDYSDNSCRRYFLCSQLRNGTLLKTPYRCPANSCINSEMHKCSSECICPCIS